jgi:hypothetical protein
MLLVALGDYDRLSVLGYEPPAVLDRTRLVVLCHRRTEPAAVDLPDRAGRAGKRREQTENDSGRQ